MGAIHHIKKQGFHFPPEKKIIKANEYLSFVEAEKIIENAKKEAQEIIAGAKAEYEEEKKRGYKDGLLESKMNMSRQMMDTVARTVNYFASVEEKLVEIVTVALKKILGEMDDKKLILKVVRNALIVARNQKQVTLRVSPTQAEMVKERINSIMAEFPGISFIDVVPDARLKQGGCILESEMGIVDASVDIQIEAIRRSLIKSFRK